MFLKTWAGPSGAVNVQIDQPRVEKMTPRQQQTATQSHHQTRTNSRGLRSKTYTALNWKKLSSALKSK